jgi:hypothetical protein
VDASCVFACNGAVKSAREGIARYTDLREPIPLLVGKGVLEINAAAVSMRICGMVHMTHDQVLWL